MVQLPHRARKTLRALIIAILVLAPVSLVPADAPESADGFLTEFFAGLRARRAAWVAGTDAWLSFGPAGTYVNLQDTRMSPLVYSGFGPGAVISDRVVRSDWIWPTTVTFLYAFPQGPRELQGFYSDIAGSLSSLFLRRVEGIRAEYAVGGGISGSTNVRLYTKLQNSFQNVDIVVSVSASGQAEVPFTFLNRAMVWSTRATVPLFSYVGRAPEYSFRGYSNYWKPPWQFFRATVETGLRWGLRWSAENESELLYSWDFYAMKELDGLHALRIATHTISLSLATRRM